MKVTAFIRKTASKNNVTDLARVYFRLRDKDGVDIKAASELGIYGIVYTDIENLRKEFNKYMK